MEEVDLPEFKRNGFIHIKNFFPREKIESVREEAKKIYLLQMLNNRTLQSVDISEKEFESGMFRFFKADLQGFTNCGKQVQHLISLHRLSLEGSIEIVLKRLGLSFPNISTRPVLYFNSRYLAKKEVYWRVFPHQDWRSMQGSLDAVVVWIPLVDIPLALGSLEVVSGSHIEGLSTIEVVDGFGRVDHYENQDFTALETEQGDALFFSAFLVHRSGTNKTDSIRWSCHFRYNNLDEKMFIDRGYPHPYLYKPQEDLITAGFPTKEMLSSLFS